MREKIRDILNKIPWPLLGIGYLMNVGWEYYLFNNDDSSPLIQQRKKIVAIHAETKENEAKLEKAAEFLRSLEVLRAKLRAIAIELDELKITISEDMDIPGFLDTINSEAKRVGLKISNISPARVNKQEFYSETAFEIAFSGAYVQLLAFLERMSQVQRVVRIETFNMKPVASITARYVELQGKVEIKTYKYEGSRADEISKREKGGINK